MALNSYLIQPTSRGASSAMFALLLFEGPGAAYQISCRWQQLNDQDQDVSKDQAQLANISAVFAWQYPFAHDSSYPTPAPPRFQTSIQSDSCIFSPTSYISQISSRAISTRRPYLRQNYPANDSTPTPCTNPSKQNIAKSRQGFDTVSDPPARQRDSPGHVSKMYQSTAHAISYLISPQSISRLPLGLVPGPREK